MKLPNLRRLLPSWKNALFAIAAALMLILAFPDFEYWFLAWFALVPLMWAMGQEKGSAVRSFVLGWVFGTIFFFGTCWWLTFAPITYAGFPWPLAYFLMIGVAAIVGIFPGIFAAILSVLLKRFGSRAILAAPFVWVFTEFLRYWLTGNNWNAIGYSQAFVGLFNLWPAIGGVALVSFGLLFLNSLWTFSVSAWLKKPSNWRHKFVIVISPFVGIFLVLYLAPVKFWGVISDPPFDPAYSEVIAIQPNVPMSGLNFDKWKDLRLRHIELAERALIESDTQRRSNPEPLIANRRPPTTVIFPESPMNYMYDDDPEFRSFINNFAIRNNVSVLFNAAEPDLANKKYFNSAVMINAQGSEVAQYDKIYLLPFGESVPFPLRAIIPAFVGSFSYGNEYDLLPLGDAKAGVMICFESHFGQLSREYVRRGADAIIEMTNDGYLGPTPVLRQHLANAVFRAVETNRPVLRVTNVGITAYINEKGEVLDPATPYKEDTRIWSVSKSNGSQTFYVKYGDWAAWLCTIVTLGMMLISFLRRVSSDVG